jgi:hypothetical protein
VEEETRAEEEAAAEPEPAEFDAFAGGYPVPPMPAGESTKEKSIRG